MPELPEVETVRRDLERYVLGKKIFGIEIGKEKIVKGLGVEEFKRYLKGRSFLKIGRRGKLLIFDLKESKKTLLVHLKMTGQLIYRFSKGTVGGGHTQKTGKLPGKYSHIILKFKDGSELFFNDLRQFGYWKLVSKKELEQILGRFGIEPLTKGFNWKGFKKLILGRKRQVKAFLLDQKMIAGIGNIYADEICFRTGVLPDRRIDSMDEKIIKKLYKEIENVLAEAVDKRGTTISDFVDLSGKSGGYIKKLKVYGREKKKCIVCKKGMIKKVKVAGRGTRFCPICQV